MVGIDEVDVVVLVVVGPGEGVEDGADVEVAISEDE
jgi:hypothetical protein